MSNAVNNSVMEVRRRMAAVTDVDLTVDPDTALITFYVSNELPPEERQRVEARMRVDAAFRRGVEAAEAIRALPAWVGLTEEDEQWLRFARRGRPNLTQVTPPSVRPIASARSALWVRAQWAAGIAAIAFLSGVGVETARVALGGRATDQRQVATSAPVPDVDRSAPHVSSSAPTITRREPTRTARATESARAKAAPTQAPTPPQVIAAAAEPARLPPWASTLPVVAATAATSPATPTNGPLARVVGERPCVFDPVLSTLAARPDTAHSGNGLLEFLRQLPLGKRAGAEQVGRIGMGSSDDVSQPPPPAPKICVGTTSAPKAP